jgi:TonB-dependent starch-binding outer membrane protein SusC
MMPRASLLLCIALAAPPATAAAQGRTITGMVLPGDTRTPFAGAEVTVVGTEARTCVDARGNFRVFVPPGEARLRITPVGYAPQEVLIAAGADTVEVGLADHVILLDGVQVVGYAATLSEQLAPVSTARLDASDVSRVPAPTLEAALQGKVVGAQILRNSGAPGGGFSIQLRGVNTILGGSDPLVVVDGVIFSNATMGDGTSILRGTPGSEDAAGRLADLNPHDIQRIELLRGAAAASRYGSRASNGVLEITTRRGVPAPTEGAGAYACFISH